jgi:hypothetical protein
MRSETCTLAFNDETNETDAERYPCLVFEADDRCVSAQRIELDDADPSVKRDGGPTE